MLKPEFGADCLRILRKACSRPRPLRYIAQQKRVAHKGIRMFLNIKPSKEAEVTIPRIHELNQLLMDGFTPKAKC